MAMHIPKGPGFSSMMKEGAKFFSGLEEAVLRNIDACKEFSDTVRTAYGPHGMNKMIINHIGKLFVTSDAAAIIRELEVQHPAAKLLMMASQAQEKEVGDGTNFVLIFAGSLLQQAAELVKMGLKPVEIAAGYERALQEALNLLPSLTIEEIKSCSNLDDMERALKPSLMSKQLGNEDMLAHLVAKACVSILPEKITNFNVDNVRVVKILSGSTSQSRVVQGMVFKRGVEGNIQRVDSNVRVACYTCPVDILSTETKVHRA
ncbi:unnamed protein product [Cyprideis torosa]|uniref:T-complex protein 1 subunit theta n=1 Tax=Cyprideis torosa TaxID=163714 RepID=A0A7R8ZIC5_9CRUS|nr:unnamed protein product [Cyprideis torosa]CAG0884492.1 unnamed protein product [Cyprideis torosa]